MKTFIKLTGVDATRILVDSNSIMVATEVHETSDHGYTQILVAASDRNGNVILKVTEAIDQIYDLILRSNYTMGGKL